MKQNYDKCIAATIDPKSSSQNENCGAFDTHFGQLTGDVAALSSTPDIDPANRVGELVQRIATIENLFYNLLFPSIPDDGFQTL